MLFTIGISSQALAQPAEFDGSTLTLPAVEVGEAFYAVSLTLVPESSPPLLEVTSLTILPEFAGDRTGLYLDGILSISALSVSGRQYWAEFILEQVEPIRFRFEHAFDLAPDAPRNQISYSATLSNSILSLPAVQIDQSFLAVDLLTVPAPGPQQLLLGSATALDAAPTGLVNRYAHGILTIPRLAATGQSYWARFDLISAEPRFRLVDTHHVTPAIPDPENAPTLILIDNIGVITGEEMTLQSQRSVLIADGVIQAVRAAGQIAQPADATVIDGSGKFLTPGLWDMHVHVGEAYSLPLFIANGVTFVRQMYGSPALAEYPWRDLAGQIDFIAPRFQIASTTMGGPDGGFGHLVVETGSEARQQVRYFHEQGADLIKVYDGLPREALLALMDEANSLGIPVAGHVPDSMGVDEVSELGMLSIEHINDVTRATTSDYDGVIAEMNARAQAEMREVNLEDRLLAQERLYAEHDPQKAAELYRRFVDNGTWMVPTLTVNRQWSQLLPNAQYNHALNSEYLQYVSSQTLSYWDSEAVVTSAGPNLSLYITRLWHNKSVLLAGMLAEGVNIVAGTDSGATYVFHGSSMHDELELLVQAGLSESQALKAATYNGAAMAGRLDEFGTIERGKTADLVLLNANPLEDIRNSREIESVIFNGQLRDRAALDAMLLRVKSDSGN